MRELIKYMPHWLRNMLLTEIICILIIFGLVNKDFISNKIDLILAKLEQRHPDLSDNNIRKEYGLAPIPRMPDTRPPVYDEQGREIDCYQPGGDKTGKCEERNRNLQGLK